MKYEIQFAKSVGIPIKEDSKYTILYNTSIPLGIEAVATEITSKDIDIHKRKIFAKEQAIFSKYFFLAYLTIFFLILINFLYFNYLKIN